MLGFGKDKETAGKSSRYKSSSVSENKNANVLLSTEKTPLSASLVEPENHHAEDPVYDLRVENEAPSQHETDSETLNLYAQIERLATEYEQVNLQLEKSLRATDELSKQLAQSQKPAKSGTLALAMAGFAVLLGIGASAVVIDMQRDITDLQNALNNLTQQTSLTENQLVAKHKELETQLAQIGEKVDSAFATDSLNNVLQVTQELKKQIQALANKNLAQLNTAAPPVKPEKINLADYSVEEAVRAEAEKKKAEHEAQLAAEKKRAEEEAKLAAEKKKAEKKSEPVAETETVKPAPADKPPTLNTPETGDETGKWFMIYGKFKDKSNAVAKFEKAGIPIQITEVKEKNQTLYRISSQRFKTKQEAQQHADYVQKTLKIRATVKKIK